MATRTAASQPNQSQSKPSNEGRAPEEGESLSARSNRQLLFDIRRADPKQEEEATARRHEKPDDAIGIDSVYLESCELEDEKFHDPARAATPPTSHLRPLVNLLQTKASLDNILAAGVDQEIVVDLVGTEFEEDDFNETDPLAVAIRHFKRIRELEYANKEVDRVPLMIDDHDVAIVVHEYQNAQNMRRWMVFDACFGVAVAANGAMEGIAAEGLVDGRSTWFYLLQCLFCVAFIIEFGIRWYFTPGGFRKMMENSWYVFDLVVITISAIDLWILELLLPSASSGGTLVIVRIVRMVRFVRLARLLRQVNALWFLVQSWLRAMPILSWSCVVILVLAYTFGLVCFEMFLHHDKLKADSDIQLYWGGLGRCMLSIMQICTYDRGGYIIRSILEGKHHHRQYVFLFLPVVAIISLGFLNLMIGTLLVCCFEMKNTDNVISHCTAKLLRHQALQEIEKFMSDSCQHQIGAAPDEAVLTCNLVLSWVEHNAKTNDGRSLQELFRDANVSVEDVQSIFREVASIKGNQSLLRVHDFIQGCLFIQTEIHELQISQYIAAQHSMYDRLTVLSEYLSSTCQVLHAAHEQVIPYLLQYSVKNFRRYEPRVDDEDSASDIDETAQTVQLNDNWLEDNEPVVCPIGQKYRPQGHLAVAEVAEMRRQKRLQRQEMIWVRFDAVFFIFVSINAVLLGVDATRQHDHERNITSDEFDERDLFWTIMEIFFVALYIVEFMLRSTMYYQLHMVDSYHTFLYILPALVFDASFSLTKRVTLAVPALLRNDKYARFDLALIVLGLIDNVCLRFFFRQSKYIIILRLFRTVRMLRVARLFYLCHDIVSIFGTVFAAVPIVLWNLIMLSGVLYIFAIFATTLIVPEIKGDDSLKTRWEDLIYVFYLVWNFATFNNWGAEVKDVSSHSGAWCYFFFLAMVFYCGLGVMKVGVGVVVQQSFRFAMMEEESYRKIAGGRVKTIGIDCTRSVWKLLQGHVERANARDRAARKNGASAYFKLWKMVVDESRMAHEDDVVSVPSVVAKHLGIHAHHAHSSAVSRQTSRTSLPTSVSANTTQTHTTANMTTATTNVTHAAATTLGKERSMFAATRTVDSGVVLPVDSVDSGVARHSSSVIITEEDLMVILKSWADVDVARPDVDPTTVDSKKLMYLLQDEDFLKGLAKEGLRPDHIIMLFQRLDVMKAGCLDRDLFIEGLQRLLYSVDGLDISNAKSVARLLYTDATEMARDSETLAQHFLDICCQIRGVTAVGNDKLLHFANSEHDVDEEHQDIVMLAREKVVSQEQRRIWKKIGASKRHIETMVDILERQGDLHVRAKLEYLIDDDPDDVSVTSVASGMD